MGQRQLAAPERFADGTSLSLSHPRSPPLLIAEAQARLLESAGKTLLAAAAAAPAVTWDALCPLAALCWGRRQAWLVSQEGGFSSAHSFPRAHQPALCSEFEQYAVLCVGEVDAHETVCVSVILELVATADAPPEFLSCLASDAPRLLSVSCEVFATTRGQSLFEHHGVHALSHALSHVRHETAEHAPYLLSVGRAGSFVIQGSKGQDEVEAAPPMFSISEDGAVLEIAVLSPTGGELRLVLRPSSAEGQPSLLLERENLHGAPGKITAAGHSLAGQLAGGAGTAYAWPQLRLEPGKCWVQAPQQRRVSLAENRFAACAWHTRSRSAPGSCPPFTAGSIWVLSTASCPFARLLSRAPPGRASRAQLHGTLRSTKLGGDSFVHAVLQRRVGGKGCTLCLGGEALKLGVPRRAGALRGVFQNYVLDLLLEENAGKQGWCLRLAASDLRETLFARLRDARYPRAKELATSFFCAPAPSSCGQFKLVQVVVIALLVLALLLPPAGAARIATVVTALLMSVAAALLQNL